MGPTPVASGARRGSTSPPIPAMLTAAAQLRVAPDETLASLGLSQVNTDTFGRPMEAPHSSRVSLPTQTLSE